jgi:hypothetical protein
LVGDNVNWHVSVCDERIGHNGFMRHAFATIAIVQNYDFSLLEAVCPQKIYTELQTSDFLPSLFDIERNKREYAIFVARAAAKLLPCFSSFANKLNKPVLESPAFLQKVNKVLPFNIMMKNEQKYADTIDILDSYETTLQQCCDVAGIQIEDLRIHIGGDQLTRERFSGAKCLRAHHSDSKASFQHLGPVTFELFHLMMNFVEAEFDEFFKSNSVREVGTLAFIKERLCRISVNGNVKKEYDAHKEFLCNVTEIYCTLAVMSHFGMNATSASATAHFEFDDKDVSFAAFMNEINSIVDKLIHANDDEKDVEGI